MRAKKLYAIRKKGTKHMFLVGVMSGEWEPFGELSYVTEYIDKARAMAKFNRPAEVVLVPEPTELA